MDALSKLYIILISRPLVIPVLLVLLFFSGITVCLAADEKPKDASFLPLLQGLENLESADQSLRRQLAEVKREMPPVVEEILMAVKKQAGELRARLEREPAREDVGAAKVLRVRVDHLRSAFSQFDRDIQQYRLLLDIVKKLSPVFNREPLLQLEGKLACLFDAQAGFMKAIIDGRRIDVLKRKGELAILRLEMDFLSHQAQRQAELSSRRKKTEQHQDMPGIAEILRVFDAHAREFLDIHEKAHECYRQQTEAENRVELLELKAQLMGEQADEADEQADEIETKLDELLERAEEIIEKVQEAADMEEERAVQKQKKNRKNRERVDNPDNIPLTAPADGAF